MITGFKEKDLAVLNEELRKVIETVEIKMDNIIPTVLPSGSIVMWYGDTSNVPDGFVLCDGVLAPDLRDRFIVGAGDTYGVGDNGGATSHGHAGSTVASSGAHQHTLPAINQGFLFGASVVLQQGNVTISDGDHTHTLTVDDKATLPPYHALCYIMKT